MLSIEHGASLGPSRLAGRMLGGIAARVTIYASACALVYSVGSPWRSWVMHAMMRAVYSIQYRMTDVRYRRRSLQYNE